MKKIFRSLAFAAFITITVISCKSIAGSDPKTAVVAFFDAMKKKDFEGAEKYATKETKSFLDLMKIATTMSNMGNKEDMDFDKVFNLQNATYGDAKITGDSTATVSLLVDGKEQMPILLKKEDGNWKVAFDMATIMRQATEKFSGMANSGANKVVDSVLQNINIDAIKDSVRKAAGDLNKGLDSLQKIKENQ